MEMIWARARHRARLGGIVAREAMSMATATGTDTWPKQVTKPIRNREVTARELHLG